MEDLNLVMCERLLKAREMEQAEIVLYPNGFSVLHQIGDIIQEQGSRSSEELEQNPFAPLRAGSWPSVPSVNRSSCTSSMQVERCKYTCSNTVARECYRLAKKLDIGDIVGVSGPLFEPAPMS